MVKSQGPIVGKFVTVGALNTLIDIVIFMVLQTFLSILASTIIASAIAMMFSFIVNSRYTFSQDALTLKSLLLFVSTTGVVMWLLQPVVIYGFNGVLEPTALGENQAVFIAKLLATGFSLVCNFLCYRYLIWPLKEKEENNG